MLAQRLLFSVFFVLIPCMVMAQDTAKCSYSFSCPHTNKISQPLVKRPRAIGFVSFYSIFECIYKPSKADLPESTCSYYKDSGLQALGSIHDNCIPTAVPCSTSPGLSDESETPLFSNPDKVEAPAWVENGHYHMYLKEHHRG